MSGGTADNNYKGFIHWTNGTSTKVQIKGTRSDEKPPAAYREPLFYSRIADSINEAGVSVPPHYLAVADHSKGTGIFISEFMADYKPLGDVYADVHTDGMTPDEAGVPNFDYDRSQELVLETLARFAASHWMDSSLNKEFFLKQKGMQGWESVC